MLQKELAAALGVSAAMVSKLAKRGMPTDSLERAQRWRKRHLEPSRVKHNKPGTPAHPTASQRSQLFPALPQSIPPIRGGTTHSIQGSEPEEDLAGGDALDGDLLFQKTREAKARATLLEIELAEKAKTLVLADDVRRSTLTAWRYLRDMLQAYGRQTAPKVAHVTDVHDLQLILEGEMRAMLQTFGERVLPGLLKEQLGTAGQKDATKGVGV